MQPGIGNTSQLRSELLSYQRLLWQTCTQTWFCSPTPAARLHCWADGPLGRRHQWSMQKETAVLCQPGNWGREIPLQGFWRKWASVSRPRGRSSQTSPQPLKRAVTGCCWEKKETARGAKMRLSPNMAHTQVQACGGPASATCLVVNGWKAWNMKLRYTAEDVSHRRKH